MQTSGPGRTTQTLTSEPPGAATDALGTDKRFALECFSKRQHFSKLLAGTLKRITSSDKRAGDAFSKTAPATPQPAPLPRNAPPEAAKSPSSAVRPAVSKGDRRLHPRRESACIVSVCVKSTQVELSAQRIAWLLHSSRIKGKLLDVSMSGMALELYEPIDAGAEVLLRINNRNIKSAVDVTAKVLRCTAQEGYWHVICRLTKNLTFEQIHQVGNHLFSSTIV